MSVPANLYPGLNDIVDVLEEFPLETSRYFTLLHEIDAKCVHSTPSLNDKIDSFLEGKNSDKGQLLRQMNGLFEELMPSLEEKMHVSSIMLESLRKLTSRLELAYEVAIRNQEIPSGLRLGAGNHPAMHLHHELMEKIDAKSGANGGSGGSGGSKTSQALRSESRREAMVANKKHATSNPRIPQDAADDYLETDSRKRVSATSNGSGPDARKPKRRANVSTVPIGRMQEAQDDSEQPNARTNEYGEPLYCYCNQVAYGEMVGCDGANCELEWFHLPCIHLDHIPKGKWYCDDCKRKKA